MGVEYGSARKEYNEAIEFTTAGDSIIWDGACSDFAIKSTMCGGYSDFSLSENSRKHEPADLYQLTMLKINYLESEEMKTKHASILNDTIKKIGSQIDKDVQYNGAFSKSVELFGDMYFASKIYEKTMRIIHLTKGNESSFESLEDSLEDCMGYCMLALAEIRNRRK